MSIIGERVKLYTPYLLRLNKHCNDKTPELIKFQINVSLFFFGKIADCCTANFEIVEPIY